MLSPELHQALLQGVRFRHTHLIPQGYFIDPDGVYCLSTELYKQLHRYLKTRIREEEWSLEQLVALWQTDEASLEAKEAEEQ